MQRRLDSYVDLLIVSGYTQRFNGQHGQAFLFESVFNIIEADPEDRQMTTGLHRVRDIRCAKCGQTMGWKYVRSPKRLIGSCSADEVNPRLRIPAHMPPCILAGKGLRDVAKV